MDYSARTMKRKKMNFISWDRDVSGHVLTIALKDCLVFNGGMREQGEWIDPIGHLAWRIEMNKKKKEQLITDEPTPIGVHANRAHNDVGIAVQWCHIGNLQTIALLRCIHHHHVGLLLQWWHQMPIHRQQFIVKFDIL